MSVRENDIGYVYLVKLDKYYKIGKTKNKHARLGEFTKLPFELEPVCMMKVLNYGFVETELHEMFQEKRTRGEWFLLNDDDIIFIKQYLKNLIYYGKNDKNWKTHNKDCGVVYDEISKDEKISVRSVKQQRNSKLHFPRVRLKQGNFIMVMMSEKEVRQKLKNNPAAYLALCTLKDYADFDNNLLYKNKQKYKQIDLARELGVSRQTASNHFKLLMELNLIAEIPTDRGMYYAINPDYYRHGSDIPQLVYDTFHKKVKV